MAATNKCLALINKSPHEDKPTKRQEKRRRNSVRWTNGKTRVRSRYAENSSVRDFQPRDGSKGVGLMRVRTVVSATGLVMLCAGFLLPVWPAFGINWSSLIPRPTVPKDWVPNLRPDVPAPKLPSPDASPNPRPEVSVPAANVNYASKLKEFRAKVREAKQRACFKEAPRQLARNCSAQAYDKPCEGAIDAYMKWCFDIELETGDGHRAVRDRSAAAEALRTELNAAE